MLKGQVRDTPQGRLAWCIRCLDVVPAFPSSPSGVNAQGDRWVCVNHGPGGTPPPGREIHRAWTPTTRHMLVYPEHSAFAFCRRCQEPVDVIGAGKGRYRCGGTPWPQAAAEAAA